MPEYKRREGISDKEFLNHKWFKSRPKHIQKVIREYPPWYIYHMQDGGGEEYLIHSYDEAEDDTVTLKVERKSRKWEEMLFFLRGDSDSPDKQGIIQVFGIEPSRMHRIKLNSNASES